MFLIVVILSIDAKIQGCVLHPCCSRIGSIVMCSLAWRVGCCPLNCKSVAHQVFVIELI